MKQSWDLKNNRSIEIIEVNGGWTTVVDLNGNAYKLRNSQIEQKDVPQPLQNDQVCPKCGSNDLYAGRIEQMGGGLGLVVDDEYITGCRECGWEEDTRPVRDPNFRYVKRGKYDPSKYERCLSASGNVSYTCGDVVANNLKGMTLDEVYEYAAIMLDLPVQELAKKYGHLNPGMQRMNLGNRLRKAK